MSSPLTAGLQIQKDRRIGKYHFKERRTLKTGDLGLSDRELQTLQHILDERPLRLIAEQMGLSLHTIDTFKRRLFEKLGVSTLAGAAAIASAYLSGAILMTDDTAT